LNQGDAMKVAQILEAARRSARFRARLLQFPQALMNVRGCTAPDNAAFSLPRGPGSAAPWPVPAAHAHGAGPQGKAGLSSITDAQRTGPLEIVQAVQGRMLQMFYQDIVQKLLKEAGHPGS
jgi:hypothetical protein